MNITVRLTTDDDKHLFAYSHSIAEAVLTCPRWGITRYVKGLSFATHGRAMALEAGSAMHEVFAAMRLWQLLRVQKLPGHFHYHGARLFNNEDNPDRFASCWEDMEGNASASPRDELLAFTFKILNTGTFYDDPDDGIRTVSNMEVSIMKYVDTLMPTMSKYPIWVANVDDPTAPVGIECIFDMVIEEWKEHDDVIPQRQVRYIGTIDGLIQLPDRVRPDENKTASRLDETFRKSYQVKTQPTGYIVAAELFTGQKSTDTRIIGIKVKQTKSHEDMISFVEERVDWQKAAWLRTLFFCDDIVRKYANPLEAPQFTHSCSRYFRPCAFIDWCSAEPEDQVAILEEMVPAELSPSQAAVGIKH